MLTAVMLLLIRTEACLRLAERLLSRVSRRLAERALAQLRAAGTGLGAIAAPRLLTPIFLLSARQWLLMVGTIACSVKALGPR